MTTTKRLMPGVFIGSHAVGEGWLTSHQLRSRGYRRLVQGVYADPGLELDHRLRCQGVALLLPPGAVVGGHSAAAWYDAPFARPADPVTVLQPVGVRWDGPRGVRVHRTVVAAADRATIDDVPISAAMRTAWDVAALESLSTAVAALDAMVRGGHVDLPRLQAMVEQNAGRFGVARLRRALPLVDARAESPSESRVRVALVFAGLAPEAQYDVVEAGQWLARVDFAWPDARVALEYDGEHHFEDDQIPQDDERLRRLRDSGWVVLRIAAPDLRNLDGVVTRVRQTLNAR